MSNHICFGLRLFLLNSLPCSFHCKIKITQFHDMKFKSCAICYYAGTENMCRNIMINMIVTAP